MTEQESINMTEIMRLRKIVQKQGEFLEAIDKKAKKHLSFFKNFNWSILCNGYDGQYFGGMVGIRDTMQEIRDYSCE
ncbi:MAG: hypothetical protein AAB792_02860 [Patescibacteria group bacterium]